MPHFASPRKASRAYRPLAATAACALLVALAVLAAACDFAPMPTPVSQSTPPPATSGNPPPGNAELAIGSADLYYLARHTGCASGLKMVSYRSTDGGKTWPAMNIEITSIHASNASIVYATTCSGVVKSTDSGATWSGELAGSKVENSDTYAITSSPDGESVYVASASEGGSGHLKRSTDGGATWQEI